MQFPAAKAGIKGVKHKIKGAFQGPIFKVTPLGSGRTWYVDWMSIGRSLRTT